MAQALSERASVAKTLEQIRDHALAHLRDAAAPFDAAAAFAEIDALALSEAEMVMPAYFEARALTILTTDVPPQRAGKMLYGLFRARMAEQEFALFEDFQAELAGLASVNTGPGGLRLVRYFGNSDHDKVWDATTQALRQVEDLIGPAFLNSGTLLGTVRERGLLMHDDDVDLAVVLPAKTHDEAAEAWIAAYHALHKAGLLEKEVKRNRGVFKVKSSPYMSVDLFPAWVEEGKFYLYPHTYGTLEADDVLPLAVCPMTRLPIPRDAGKLLASNYGEGWGKPDPGYKFRWRRANRIFRRFHAALEADLPRWTL